ncbi:MAG: DUF6719 family protein [Pseudolabrys sp.]
MRAGKLIMFAAFAAGACVLAAPALAQVLTAEPPMGALMEGQRVLVADGTCGAGKIKEVVGGNHVEVGGFKRVKRIRRCVARR